MRHEVSFFLGILIASPSLGQSDEISSAVEASIPESLRNDGIKCKPKGSTVTEAILQATYNDFGTSDATIVSVGLAERFCEQSLPIQWSLEGAIDTVRSGGRSTTAGRAGVGILYRAHATEASRSGLYSSLVLGANAYLGYEEYDIDVITNAGASRVRGSRATKVFGVVGAYTLVNLSDRVKFPPSFSAVKAEVRTQYVDKRASGVSLPVRLDEGYIDASGAVAFDQFIDSGTAGLKIEYRATYQRLFTDRFAVNEFTTFRVQFRPQAIPETDFPDRFAISLSYSVGKRFSGFNLSASKAF